MSDALAAACRDQESSASNARKLESVTAQLTTKWEAELQAVEARIRPLLGDATLVAWATVYAGALLPKQRDAALAHWQGLLRDAGIPVSSRFQLPAFLDVRRKQLLRGMPPLAQAVTPAAWLDVMCLAALSSAVPLVLDPGMELAGLLRAQQPQQGEGATSAGGGNALPLGEASTAKRAGKPGQQLWDIALLPAWEAGLPGKVRVQLRRLRVHAPCPRSLRLANRSCAVDALTQVEAAVAEGQTVIIDLGRASLAELREVLTAVSAYRRVQRVLHPSVVHPPHQLYVRLRQPSHPLLPGWYRWTCPLRLGWDAAHMRTALRDSLLSRCDLAAAVALREARAAVWETREVSLARRAVALSSGLLSSRARASSPAHSPTRSCPGRSASGSTRPSSKPCRTRAARCTRMTCSSTRPFAAPRTPPTRRLGCLRSRRSSW